MRVVALTCSNTEIVCDLGCAHWLVGVDDHSDWPVDVVSNLPRVGPDLGIDVDAVAALRPDLVLASLTVPGHDKVVERLEAAKLPLLVTRPQSLAEVADDLRDIAGALGVPGRGVERADAFLQAMAPHPENHASSRPSLLVQWWPKPVITPGRLSWVHDLLELAGARHPLDGEEVESRPLADDEVADFEVDAVVLSWCGVEPHKVRPEVVRQNPAFARLPAIVHDRIYCVPEAWLGRPSPRLISGLSALREVVSAVRNETPVRPEMREPMRWAAGLTT